MPKTTTKSYIYIAVTLIAALTAGCSESQEEKVYQTFKCAKAATMLGEDADAQIAMRNTDHLLSKINTGGSPARYGMEMGARFQEEVPLYANDREGQFQLLLEVYKSSRCKALYRQQSAPSGQTGIPEHMPGEMPLPAGGAASDAPVEQEGDRPLESLRASASDVVIDPPILGSEADHNRNEVIRPTQVFQPDDTIYLQVPYRGTGSVEHKLSTKWTFHGEFTDVPVYEAFKLIHTDGDLAALFFTENQSGWASGRYNVEVQLDGQTIRAVTFTVTEPAQSAPERSSPGPGCATAVSDLERAMCRDAGLAALDKTLADRFEQAKANSNDVWELDQAQGTWRRDRRDACRDDIACLTTAYQERIDALSP